MVYQGILTKISRGAEIAGEEGVYSTDYAGRLHYSRRRVEGEGLIERGYLVIGDTKLRNVWLLPRYDMLLEEAVGRTIALSIVGPADKPHSARMVVAMRTPEAGLVKFGSWTVMRSSIKALFKYLFAGVVFGLILGLIAGALTSNAVGILVGVVVVLYFLLSVLRNIRKAYGVRNALDAVRLAERPVTP